MTKALLGTVLFFGALAVVLMRPATPDQSRSLAYFRGNSTSTPTPLVAQFDDQGATVFRLNVFSDAAEVIQTARTLEPLLATYTASPTITSARLSFANDACVFAFQGTTPHIDNEPLVLRKEGDCRFASQGSVVGTLEIRSPDAKELAVWGRETSSSTAMPLVSVLRDADKQRVLEGRYLGPAATVERTHWDLVRHAWTLDQGTAPVGAALGLAAVLMGLGLWLVMTSRPIGAALLVAALSTVYAVVIPPFQAPDEPDHFLTYAKTSQREHLGNLALRLANHTHFDRLKFRADEHLTVADAEAKDPDGPWPRHIRAPATESRALFAPLLWSLEDRLVSSFDPPTILLTLRVLNGSFVALCVALGLWLFVRWTDNAKLTTAVGIGLLAIPTLPFFAMHFSDYTPLIGAYVLLSLTCAACAARRGISAEQAFVLGLTSGLAFVSSRSAMASIVVLVLFLPLGVVLTARADSTTFKVRARAALLTLLAAFIGFHVAGATAAPALTRLTGDSHSFFLYDGIAMVAISLTAVIGVALSPYFSAVSRRLRSVQSLLAGLIAAYLVFGAALKTSSLQTIEIAGTTVPGHARYAYLAVKTLWTSLPLVAPPDFFISQSFWGGFGWLESVPPVWLVIVAKTLTALGLIYICLQAIPRLAKTLGGHGDGAWLAVGGAVIGAWIYALGWGASVIGFNLHGRYLIGAYLLLQSLAFLGLGRAESRLTITDPKRGRLFQPALIGAVLAIHAYCAAFLLNRYF